MSYLHTWHFPKYPNPGIRLKNGNKIAISIQFTLEGSSSNLDIEAENYGCKLINAGKTKLGFDMDDFLIMPGEYSGIKIFDRDGELKKYFYDYTNVNREAHIIVTLTKDDVNWTTEFIGKVVEDSVKYGNQFNDRLLSFTARPRTYILNNTLLYDQDGAPLNPLNYSLGNEDQTNLITLINDIYKKIDPNCALTFSHDWNAYAIFHQVSPGQTKDDIPIPLPLTDISILNASLFNYSKNGLRTLADILRSLAYMFGSVTGMYSENAAFFKKIDYNLNSIALATKDISDRKDLTEENNIKFIRTECFNVGTGWTPSTDLLNLYRKFQLGQQTEVDDQKIDKKIPNWFTKTHSLIGGINFYYFVSNLRIYYNGKYYKFMLFNDPRITFTNPPEGATCTIYNPTANFVSLPVLTSFFWSKYKLDQLGKYNKPNLELMNFANQSGDYAMDKIFQIGNENLVPIGLEKNYDECKTKVETILRFSNVTYIPPSFGYITKFDKPVEVSNLGAIFPPLILMDDNLLGYLDGNSIDLEFDNIWNCGQSEGYYVDGSGFSIPSGSLGIWRQIKNYDVYIFKSLQGSHPTKLYPNNSELNGTWSKVYSFNAPQNRNWARINVRINGLELGKYYGFYICASTKAIVIDDKKNEIEYITEPEEQMQEELL